MVDNFVNGLGIIFVFFGIVVFCVVRQNLEYAIDSLFWFSNLWQCDISKKYLGQDLTQGWSKTHKCQCQVQRL